MKNVILLFCLVLFSTVAFSQQQKEYDYKKVVKADGTVTLTKTEFSEDGSEIIYKSSGLEEAKADSVLNVALAEIDAEIVRLQSFFDQIQLQISTLKKEKREIRKLLKIPEAVKPD